MKRRMIALALVLLLACTGYAESGQDSGPVYVENEWNFVEGSLDISGGIPEDAGGMLAAIREAGVLRVGTEPCFPPQEFIDPALSGQAQYVGSDVELARRVAERMGVALEIIPMEFTHVLDAVADGECDLVISALSYIPDRAAKVTMSKGYHFSEGGVGSGLLIRAADAGTITGLESLKGLNIAAQSGSLQEALAAQNISEYREFRRPDAMQSVYDAVSSGLADAAIVDVESTRSYVENNPEKGLALVEGVHFSLEPQFDGDRVAAKKGELQLMYFVNGVIDEILEKGEYRKWYDAYEEYAKRIDAE